MSSKIGKPKGTENYPDDIKRLIASIYHEYKDWSAPKIHWAVSKECKSRGWKCPGESTVRKEMAKIASKWQNEPRLKPWSLAGVTDFPQYFPADVIPLLLEITAEAPTPPAYPRVTVTIWVAIWIARLYKIPGINNHLIEIAEWYATYEQSCLLAGIDCDTSRFDGPDGETIYKNLLAYFRSGDNIFTTHAGRTAYADQRQYDNSLLTQIVIESDKKNKRTLKKGGNSNGKR